MKVLGIIFSYSSRENLRELTKRRALASVPFGAKYRVIDFPLSNMANDGIYEISIVCRNNYHSLIDHLSSGKEWDLERKRGGLRVLTPYDLSGGEDVSLYRGVIDGLRNNMDSIQRSDADYVILCGTSTIHRINYNELLKSHVDTGADITVAYTKKLNKSEYVPKEATIFEFDENGRLYDLSINGESKRMPGATWGIDICVIEKHLLESLILDGAHYEYTSFSKDFLKRLAPSLYIRGYEYDGFILEFNTVDAYMKANMCLLRPEFREMVFKEPIYTKHKDSVPTRYFEGCSVSNSLISEGCKIEGTVVNSLLSRDVKVGKNSIVKNSIIMQNTEILGDVVLDNVIIDKDVIVRENRNLKGHTTYPVVVEKGSIV